MSSTRKKRPYRRNTPIGRLRRNAEKSAQHARLLRSRLVSWGQVDERVSAAAELAAAALEKVQAADEILAGLEETGFVPPDKTRTVSWEPGQRVAVGKKFKEKYEWVFRDVLTTDPGFLDDLVVDSVLPSGEVSVRRPRGRNPFLVPKTHLVGVEGEAGGSS